MRVLISGQSGLDKANFLKDLERLCNDKKTDRIDPLVALDGDQLRSAYIDLAVDLEHEFEKNSNVQNYLDMNESEFISGKSKILSKISSEYPPNKNVVIGTHLTYFRKKSIFHKLDWEALRLFEPNLIITLIDDVHRIYDTLKERDDPDDYTRSVTMKDLLFWREAEIMISQTLAENLLPGKKISHFIIAKGHRPQIVYQLMFEQHKKRVYASYPITRAKSDPNLWPEIQMFLAELKKHFVVFDPYTMQEKLLHDRVVQHLGGPLPRSGTVPVEDREYRIEEIIPIITDINGQIITRDERLIKQSNAVIAYRPAMSAGATYETIFAQERGLYVITYHPIEDGQSPFAYKGIQRYEFQDFLKEIKRYAGST